MYELVRESANLLAHEDCGLAEAVCFRTMCVETPWAASAVLQGDGSGRLARYVIVIMVDEIVSDTRGVPNQMIGATSNLARGFRQNNESYLPRLRERVQAS